MRIHQPVKLKQPTMINPHHWCGVSSVHAKCTKCKEVNCFAIDHKTGEEFKHPVDAESSLKS